MNENEKSINQSSIQIVFKQYSNSIIELLFIFMQIFALKYSYSFIVKPSHWFRITKIVSSNQWCNIFTTIMAVIILEILHFTRVQH
jgi:hypothetical protein